MRTLPVMILLLSLALTACAGQRKEGNDALTNDPAINDSSLKEAGNYTWEILEKSDYEITNRKRGSLCLGQTAEKGRWRISSGEKSTGGYGLSVKEVREEDGIAAVILQETEPGPDSVVTTALTYPAITLTLSPCPPEVIFETEDGTVFEPITPLWEEPRRALMTDGVRYLDTGCLAAPGLRCGTMDGYAETVIERAGMPKQDGEANFASSGWQYAGDMTIDVLIDGEFWIFAKEYSDPEEGKTIPDNVFTFLATVEEVRDDGTMIVRTDDQIVASQVLENNTRYLLPVSAYEGSVAKVCILDQKQSIAFQRCQAIKMQSKNHMLSSSRGPLLACVILKAA